MSSIVNELLRRERERTVARLAEIDLAASGMANPATAPEAQAALDVVPVDLRPLPPTDGKAARIALMQAGRETAAARRAQMMKDDATFATSEEDHLHLAKHADIIDMVMEGNDSPLKKGDASLLRAVDTLLKRAVATEQHGGARNKSKVVTHLMKDDKTRLKRMRGRGFGNFMRGVGKTLWSGVKLASKVAVPVAAVFAPEFLPAAIGASAAVGAIDAATKKPDLSSISDAITKTAVATRKVGSIGDTTSFIPE